MPLIQVIPTAKAKNAAPGWAYVLEPIIDPSRLPLSAEGGPRSGNKRAAARTATDIILGANTKSQATKVRTRLEALAKDNPSHSEIILPDNIKKELAEAKWKKGLDKPGAPPAKMTPNVRKILGSDKTWAHHAADVQAELDLMKQNEDNVRRKSKVVSTPLVLGDVDMIDAVDEIDEDDQSPAQIEELQLMHAHVPQMPSQATLDELTKTMPLAYAAAAAGPSKSTVPPKRFCAMCGYWGKIRCTVCGDFICGLNCKRTHDGAEHGGGGR